MKKQKIMQKIDMVLQTIQMYSYKLPTGKIGNRIMDFREKHTLKYTL